MGDTNRDSGSTQGLKTKLALAAAWLPVNAWHTLCGRPLLLPYYHLVSDKPAPHAGPLYRFKSVAEFKRDLDFLLAHFQPIGLDDLLNHLREHRPLPPRAFLLSFDDGFREMAEVVAPILKAKGVSAAFFLNPAFIDNRELCLHQKAALLLGKLEDSSSASLAEKIKRLFQENGITGNNVVSTLKRIRYADRAVLDQAAALCNLHFDVFLKEQKPYLTSDQIRALLRDGFTIGAHSMDHPFYGDLPLEEQLRQTRESVNFLQDKFGVSQRAFAFPHSDSQVSRAFFERAFGDGTLQISFGTGGLLRDTWPGHFQRFSMEKPPLPPAATVSRHYARRLLHGAVTHPG